MRRARRYIVAVSLFGAVVAVATARAEIAVVIEHQWTIGNNGFASFSFNPATDEFRTGGYLAGNDFRWSQVIDDTVLPWEMDGGLLLSNFQWEIFVRDGFAANSGSFNSFGMVFCPLDESYFLSGIGILRGPSGSTRLDAERELLKHYPGLPDSPQVMPTNCSVSNVGGVYKLIDDNLTPGDGFISRGVQVGHQVTIFPVDVNAEVLPRTYTVMEVLSETEVRLDQDPSYGDPVETGIGYLMSIQPHLTLGALRAQIPYFVATPTAGGRASFKGGVSLDGQTLYLCETQSDHLLAINTQVANDFEILLGPADLSAYVQEQVNAGRRHTFVSPYYAVYRDTTDSDWAPKLVGATATDSTEQAYTGTRSHKVTFAEAGAVLAYESDPGMARIADDVARVDFWMLASAGGLSVEVRLANSNGVGSAVPLAAPAPGEWTHYIVPISSFDVPDNIFRIEFHSTAAGAQEPFYLDDVNLKYVEPLPPYVGAYDPTQAGLGTSDTTVDHLGRVVFVEGYTDDVVWTDDSGVIHTLLPSWAMGQASAAAGLIDPASYEASNAVQVLGLVFDRMGTMYWSDNTTRSIWKAAAYDRANNIKLLASRSELQTALNLSSANPRGLQCFHIRHDELLTFNFVDGNFIYKVDLETQDFGDFDGDVDVDVDDYTPFFADCMSGPGVDVPPVGCTPEEFALADLDDDGDVDVADFAFFQAVATGPLP